MNQEMVSLHLLRFRDSPDKLNPALSTAITQTRSGDDTTCSPNSFYSSVEVTEHFNFTLTLMGGV